MAERRLRIGTRNSTLALTQARWVAQQLVDHGVEVELIEVTTSGDKNQSSPLDRLGSTGLFTKEIQQALLAEEVDLAVHSLKDLPTESTAGLTLAAVPPREQIADALVCANDKCDSLLTLREGANVGTGSLRRRAQLLHTRPDLQVSNLRGNVDTRLAKLDAGQYEAIVLAAAGLNRLGLQSRIACLLPMDVMLPAVGQGALGLETRSDDHRTGQDVAALDHPETHAATIAERSMLAGLRAGCQAPVGACCEAQKDELILSAVVLDRAGRQRIEVSDRAPIQEADSLGQRVAAQLLSQGAADLISASRESR